VNEEQRDKGENGNRQPGRACAAEYQEEHCGCEKYPQPRPRKPFVRSLQMGRPLTAICESRPIRRA
jgi:hypothetical protein